MRLPRPKWTLRALMVAVAVCAIGFFIVEQIRRRDPVNRALRILSSKDASARRQAARDLALLGPRAADAAPTLAVVMIRDPDAGVRLDACFALRSVLSQTPSVAFPALTAALRDGDPEVRNAALSSLIVMGARSPEMVEALADRIARPERWRSLGGYWTMNLDTIDALRFLKPSPSKIVPILRTGMASGDEDHRSRVVHVYRELANWSEPDDEALADALLEALEDPSGEVRREAVPVLLSLAPPTRQKAVASLAAMLRRSLRGGEEPDDKKAAEAAQGLAQFVEGPRATLRLLLPRLEAEDVEARLQALSLLGAYGPAGFEAVPRVVRAMTSPDEAREAMATPGQDWRSLGYGLATLRSFGPEAVRFASTGLAEVVAGGKPERRAPAARALAQFEAEGAAAIPTLLKVLEGRPLETSLHVEVIAALASIGREGSHRVVETLTGRLGHENATVRRAAAAGLRLIGPEAARAIPALIEMAGGDDPEDRRAAAGALGTIGTGTESSQAVLVVLRRLLLDDDDDRVRAEAAEALALRGPEARRDVAAIGRLLDSLDPQIRAWAAGVLSRLGANAEEAVPSLIGGLDDEDEAARLAATRALDRVSPRQHRDAEAAAAALRNPIPSWRRGAAADLARLSGTWAGVASLEDGLNDDDASVRAAVVATLGHLGGWARAATPGLIEALADRAPEVRSAAARALARVAPERPETVSALLERVRDPEEVEDVRLAAIAALGRLGRRAASAAPALAEEAEKPETPERRRKVLRWSLEAIGSPGGGR